MAGDSDVQRAGALGAGSALRATLVVLIVGASLGGCDRLSTPARAPPTCYSIRIAAQVRARLGFLRTLNAVMAGCAGSAGEGELTFALQHLPSGRWTWKSRSVGASELAICLNKAMEAQVFRMLPTAPEAVEAMTFTASLSAGYPGHGKPMPVPDGGLECWRDLECPGDLVCACADTGCSLVATPGLGRCLAPDSVTACF